MLSNTPKEKSVRSRGQISYETFEFSPQKLRFVFWWLNLIETRLPYLAACPPLSDQIWENLCRLFSMNLVTLCETILLRTIFHKSKINRLLNGPFLNLRNRFWYFVPSFCKTWKFHGENIYMYRKLSSYGKQIFGLSYKYLKQIYVVTIPFLYVTRIPVSEWRV